LTFWRTIVTLISTSFGSAAARRLFSHRPQLVGHMDDTSRREDVTLTKAFSQRPRQDSKLRPSD
jgi:hypothetical protein